MRSGRRSWLVTTLALFATVVTSSTLAADSFDALLAQGQFAAAEKLARMQLTQAEHASAATPAAVADALVRLSRVALERNRPETPELESWLARALTLREKLDGAQSASAAEVKLMQARRLAKLDRAEPAFATALQTQGQTNAWPLLLNARIAGVLASIQNQRADPKSALQSATLAEQLARSQGDAAVGVLIDALDDQAFALVRMRKGGDALAPGGEAEQLARERFGAQSRQRADALRIVAYARRDQGDFGGAINALEQALDLQRAQAEVDQRQVSLLLLNLGQTLKISGNSEAALKRYEQALANDAHFADPAGRNRASILHGLANLYRDRNDNRRAVTLYSQALLLFERIYGADSTQLAQVVNNYANARGNLGEYDAAIALYERALAIARRRESRDPADYLPQANLAMVKVWQGRYAAAEPDFREVLERLRGVAAGSEASALFVQLGLAASLWGQNRLDEAFAAAISAETIRQSGLRLAATHLGEQHAIGFQEYLRPSLDFVLAIATASGNPEHLERAWEVSIAARGQVTSIVAQRLSAARAARDPNVAPLWQAWRDASAAVARTELAVDADETRKIAARAALDRAERAFSAATNPLSAALDGSRLNFTELRRGVPDDTALVLFASVQPRLASDFAKLEAEQHAPDLYAFVLPAAGHPVRALRLGALDEATRLVDAWSAALSDRNVAQASVAARGRDVRARLWDPLAAAIPGKRVFLIPQGPLFRVPWPALPDQSGFLLDAGYVFHVIDHERELLQPALPPSSTQRLLAVADPTLAASPPARARGCAGAQPLSTLPGARREVKGLSTLWRTHFSGGEAVVLEGSEATEAHVRSAAARADVLHFATHGISIAGDCAPTGTRGFTLAAEAPAGDTAAPAFASAALALATGDAAGSDDDGVLSAEEITALDLSRVRWAVLAACSTAAGTAHHYEGLFGLARAFRLAGARTVITSLWPVDDAATAAWSQALYEARLTQHADSATALRDAQASVLAARRSRGESTHPYYWAAFVASGDWR